MFKEIKSGFHTVLRIILPKALNERCPALGSLIELAIAYDDHLAAQNLETLVNELNMRVDDLDKKLKSMRDVAVVKKIKQLTMQALKECHKEKISLYAAIIAGEISHAAYDWDKDLQTEFSNTIVQLSGAELILLNALYDRKRGEAVPLSPNGKTWLIKNIVMTNSTLSWIDSLVKKGLVEDVSVEKISSEFGSPGLVGTKSRSAVRLLTFARSMISFMMEAQENSRQRT